MVNLSRYQMSNINKLSQQQLKELIATKAARDGFPEYCVTIDPRYQLEWFHEQIALKLEEAVSRVEKGEDVRLMIFMPPRHGKSDTATQKFPSWVLGKRPDWPFIVASYSQELATDFGQGTRDLMESPNYRTLFKTRLREDSQAKAKWMTEQKGGYTAVGVGGAITGRGFKIGIVDDPFKNREEADSPVIRENVHKWWRSTFYTRQEGNTAIILILTRWHDDDLAGRLLKEQAEAEKFSKEDGDRDFDRWEVIKFPALAEVDDKYRKAGDALWPKKFSRAKLLRHKATLGSYEFSALYQQNPIDEENQEFKRSWIQYRTADEVSKMKTRKFATIDSALSKKAESDFTGVTRNYVNDLNEWNLKCQRYRISSKQLIDLIFTLHDEGMEAIGIEEGAYLSAVEPFLKDEMEKRGKYPNMVTLKHGGTMKETRIRGLIPRYENKKIFHIDQSCSDLEEEYFRFPKAVHDDCLDATAYQNQIASPPSAGVGDRIDREAMEDGVSDRVNMQEGTIVIGFSTQKPGAYVIGNKEGIFFNRLCDKDKDPYEEIDALMRRWDKAYLVSDQMSDAIGLKKLQEKYPGRVFIAWLKTDPKSQEFFKWGDGDRWGEVDIGKSAAIQIISDEIRERRVTFNGTLEEWIPFIDEWANLFRTWEENAVGEKVPKWESSGKQDYIRSLIYFRVGIDRFGETAATIISDDLMGDIPTGRVFNNDFNI